MHLFDSEDSKKTQTSFYVSTGVISILTWVTSYYSLQWYRSDEDRKGPEFLKSIAIKLWYKLGMGTDMNPNIPYPFPDFEDRVRDFPGRRRPSGDLEAGRTRQG